MNLKLRKTRIVLILQSVLYTFLMSLVAFAASANNNKAVNSLKKLGDMISALVAAAGTIVFFWGIFNLASAIQSHDSTAMQQATMKIVAGGIMIGAAAIKTFLLS